MRFIGLFLSSIVIEGIISYAKSFVNKEPKIQQIFAIILGIGISYLYQLDIFEIAGLSSRIPHIGPLLTGILLSRGSNYIFDIIKTIMLFPLKLRIDNINENVN